MHSSPWSVHHAPLAVRVTCECDGKHYAGLASLMLDNSYVDWQMGYIYLTAPDWAGMNGIVTLEEVANRTVAIEERQKALNVATQARNRDVSDSNDDLLADQETNGHRPKQDDNLG
ncbi:hypothetical protein BBJ28_00019876 [Nothophytophthora sp. Chile5]|nr:hypothetical protein BBJ28_00019876 [Nothophytophthora sp. Chile5]